MVLKKIFSNIINKNFSWSYFHLYRLFYKTYKNIKVCFKNRLVPVYSDTNNGISIIIIENNVVNYQDKYQKYKREWGLFLKLQRALSIRNIKQFGKKLLLATLLAFDNVTTLLCFNIILKVTFIQKRRGTLLGLTFLIMFNRFKTQCWNLYIEEKQRYWYSCSIKNCILCSIWGTC